MFLQIYRIISENISDKLEWLEGGHILKLLVFLTGRRIKVIGGELGLFKFFNINLI
jgi:hypothetical protein